MTDLARLTVPTAAFAHLPATRQEAAALLVYDPRHADGDPWRYAGVFRDQTPNGSVSYSVRVTEHAPWGTSEAVTLGARHPSAVEAAKMYVRYLKWRHGDAWRPDDARPDLIDVFNDAVEDNEAPSWVGRVWVNGVPELVFADGPTEAGFAHPGEALTAVRAFVRTTFPDWRNWLSRAKRPACPTG